LRLTADHLEELEALAEAGDTDAVRTAVFDLVAQIRGERAASGLPNLRVVKGGVPAA
jgi:O-antigen biosynthesis protein WbqV